MVGDSGETAASKEPPKAAGPKVKSFSCPGCGAPVTVKYAGFSLSAVCSACFSVIDITDDNYRILSRYFSKTSLFKPYLPLGARGKLDGKIWEVIGFMIRTDVASGYFWSEYLLFNPYYGYRWLTEDHGHWSLIRSMKEKPDGVDTRHSVSAHRLKFKGKDFRLYNRGSAKVTYVLGEFYWRVVVDSRVEMTDYICPPEMLSREKDDNEIVWSLGKYIEPDEIEKAFKLTNRLPVPVGVAPNQPSTATDNWRKICSLWLCFMFALTLAQMFFACTASNKLATTFVGTFTPGQKTTDTTTPVFSLDKESSNIKLTMDAPVSNSWLYIAGELVNDDNGTTYPFDRSIEYYSGYDSDGFWSEGNTNSSLVISSIPAGKYYLNLDTENGDFKDTNSRQYTLAVFRDVPTFANYFWCLFFLSIVPMWAWIRMRMDEVARWSNSDFSPYASVSS